MEPFSFGITSLLLWLIDTTKYITLLICLIFIIKALTWKKLPAWWHYGLWLLLVLRMLMPWVPESRLSMFNYVPVFKYQTYNASALKENVSFAQILISQDSHLPTLKDQGLPEGTVGIKHKDNPKHRLWSDFTLNQVLLLVWLSGALGVCLFVVFKNLGFWIVVRKKSPVIDQEILDQLEACKRQMRIQTDVSLIMTDKVKSPALFGYIHPRLLLPKGILERLDQDKLRYVFLHELAHLKRHDIAISWLVTVLQAIHWFNPFVWYAFYQMRIDQEIACDAYVLSQLERHQATRYAHTLVGLLECFLENRQVPALAGILESKSRIRRRIITIVQNRQYSKTLTFSAVSLFLFIGFTFLTTAKGTSTEKKPFANEPKKIIDVQPKATDGVFSEAMTRDDSGVLKGERMMQEIKEKSRAEISASSSNEVAMNDILKRSNEVMLKILEQQELNEKKARSENELTEMEKDDNSIAAQPTTKRRQVEEQIQTVVTTHAQSVSTEEPFVNNEKSRFLKDVGIAGDESDALEKDNLISVQASDVVQEAKTDDNDAKETENAENLLDDTRLLTSAEESNAPIGVTNAYPSVMFRDYTDERITTTSLLHYLEGNGHDLLYSYEVEWTTEEKRASSIITEDPGLSGVEEEPSGMETPDAFRVDEPPRILSKGPVTYPFRAKRLGLTGKVSVSFLVNEDGHATNIEAVKAEPENALMTFAGAAKETIAKSRFKPATSAGEPVPVKVMAQIRFENI